MCIKFDIKILLFLVIFYITNQYKIYLLFMAFIFLHELTHLMIAIILRAKPMTMELRPEGCSISFSYKLDDYNKKIWKGNLVELKKIFIYIAGPLFNLIVGIIALFLGKNAEIYNCNFAIYLMNCFPIYPLDGGRIIKSILHILFGEKIAYKIILKISNIFFIILLIICSFIVLIYQNIGIIIGLILIALIKIKYSKEIKMKLRLMSVVSS